MLVQWALALIVGVAVAQAATSPVVKSAVSNVSVTRDITDLRTNLLTLNAIVERMAQATSIAQRQQLLTESSQLVSADLGLLSGLDGVCEGTEVTVPQSSSSTIGTAPMLSGTPVPPAFGSPFPFSGGTALLP